MTDLEIQRLILDSLKSLESKNEKLHDKVDELNINYALQSKDISQIKIDLAKHIEGTIQNRQRLEVLEKHDGEQAFKIQQAIDDVKEEFKPVVEWVHQKREFPKKFMIHTSKVFAALAAAAASATGITKLIMWLITHFKS